MFLSLLLFSTAAFVVVRRLDRKDFRSIGIFGGILATLIVFTAAFWVLPAGVQGVFAGVAVVQFYWATWEITQAQPSSAAPQDVMDAAATAPTDELAPPAERLPGWYPANVEGQRGFRWWDPAAGLTGGGDWVYYRGHAADYTNQRWRWNRGTVLEISLVMGAMVTFVTFAPRPLIALAAITIPLPVLIGGYVLTLAGSAIARR